MDKTLPPAAELIDRLTVAVLKAVKNPAQAQDEIREVERLSAAIDERTESALLNPFFIRLIIALAQINFHIWRAKEIMQREVDKFDEKMKLAHQLNGIRNQIKNRIEEALLGEGTAPRHKSNISTEDLHGWKISVLDSPTPETGNQKKSATEKAVAYTSADLLDAITITQIKEMLFREERGMACSKELAQLETEVGARFAEKKMKLTGRFIYLLVFLAQANLHVWYAKDDMQEQPKRYYDLLRFAQDMNSLRNHAKNLLMEFFKEDDPALRKSIFFFGPDSAWYAPLLYSLGATKELWQRSDNLQYMTAGDFATIVGVSEKDLPTDVLAIFRDKDLSYESLSGHERDEVIQEVVERLLSSNYWVSGEDKQGIWEKGWVENLTLYDKTKKIESLIPKFIRPHRALRYGGEYIRPRSADFEFDAVDAYRRWAFRTYFTNVESIYEFGCGSCQHAPVIAEMFPKKEFHGLDWSEASAEILLRLARDYGWLVRGHTFDMFKPDKNLPLGHGAGVFTVGTMEQLGSKFEPFVEFLLTKKPAVVFHMETIREFYDPAHLPDYLAIEYDRRRNYLDGYLTYLRRLEKEGRIKINCAFRFPVGSMYHDSYSFITWKPL